MADKLPSRQDLALTCFFLSLLTTAGTAALASCIFPSSIVLAIFCFGFIGWMMFWNGVTERELERIKKESKE
jgi:hypothetical protein